MVKNDIEETESCLNDTGFNAEEDHDSDGLDVGDSVSRRSVDCSDRGGYASLSDTSNDSESRISSGIQFLREHEQSEARAAFGDHKFET